MITPPLSENEEEGSIEEIDRINRREYQRIKYLFFPEKRYAWRNANRDHWRAADRARYAEHKEAIRAKQKQWLANNPGKSTEYGNKWRAKNPDYMHQYYLDHKEEYIDRAREAYPTKWANDPAFRVLKTLRARLNTEMRKALAQKSANTLGLLGCSIGRFMEYMAAHFQKGMTWANYGTWHIDHRIPCSKFNLINPEDQKKCFNFLNLQPLWATDNLSKSNKIVESQYTPNPTTQPPIGLAMVA